jgi:hypothetical protein
MHVSRDPSQFQFAPRFTSRLHNYSAGWTGGLSA